MLKAIKSHSDQNFVKKFHRYLLLDLIIESKSFLYFKKRLRVSGFGNDGDLNLIFQEFRLFNLVVKIEYEIIDLIEKFFVQGVTKKELSKFIFNRVKKFRCLDCEKTKIIISGEIDGKEQRMYTPHFLLYVAGLGLGGLIYIIKKYTKTFKNKTDIINKLTEFSNYRNNLMHNLLSSRVESNKEIKIALELGKKIRLELYEMIKSYEK